MITVSKYSKTMYVVRGSTDDSLKDTLKSYGLKWTRTLKGGPGYVLRVNKKSDYTTLNTVKKIVDERNKAEQVCVFHERRPAQPPHRLTAELLHEYITILTTLFMIHIMVCYGLKICFFYFKTIYIDFYHIYEHIVSFEFLRFIVYPIIDFPSISVDYNNLDDKVYITNNFTDMGF